MNLLFYLLVAHAVCDYPLQGPFLSQAKNYRNQIPGVPFWQALVAHAVIHGGAVMLLTSSLYLGLLEVVLHTAIDHAKCMGWFGEDENAFNVDQFLHVLSKTVYVVLCAI